MGQDLEATETPDGTVGFSLDQVQRCGTRTAPETSHDGELDASREGRVCCCGGLVGGVCRRGGLRLFSRWGTGRRGEFPGFWDGIQISFAFRELDEKVLRAEGRGVV